MNKPPIGEGGNEADGFDDWLNKGEANNTVYNGINQQGEAVYTGITKQTLEARLYQHNYTGKNFSALKEKLPNLTRNQARATEQYYIGLKDGLNAMNKIFSISTNNKYYKYAKNWAIEYIETH